MTRRLQDISAPRRRILSEEERELWESVAKTAKPLRVPKKPKAAEALADDVPDRPIAPKVKRAKAAPAIPPVVPTLSPKPPPLAALTRRMKSRIARGATSIDGRIDLHGMTQDEAYAALFSFLKRSQADGAATVLVITGKGRIAAPDRERGVLRRRVPEWLAMDQFRTLIAGFEEAHIGHGGEGALYVRLRRKRT